MTKICKNCGFPKTKFHSDREGTKTVCAECRASLREYILDPLNLPREYDIPPLREPNYPEELAIQIIRGQAKVEEVEMMLSLANRKHIYEKVLQILHNWKS